jgi:hypothetical protein
MDVSSISSLGTAMSQAETSTRAAVAVAGKALANTKLQGQQALKLIQSAAAVANASSSGHTLSVYA